MHPTMYQFEEASTLDLNNTSLSQIGDSLLCDQSDQLNGSECSMAYLQRQAMLYQIGQIVGYVLPVTVIVGLVTNTLSLLVTLQPHNRQTSCCVLMAVLAVADNITLLAAGLYWLHASGLVGPIAQWECVFMVYVGTSAQTFGIFLIVAMTTERFIAVRFPLQSALWTSPKKAKIVSLILLTTICVYDIPHIFYTNIVFDGKDCYPYADSSLFSVVHSVMSVCLYSLIPFTIVLVLNTLIIKSLQQRKKAFKSFVMQQGTKSLNETQNTRTTIETSRDNQLTKMLLLLSFTLIIVTLSQQLLYVFYSAIQPHLGIDPLTYRGTLFLVETFSNRLFFLNNAINFFLYCLGGKKFREDLVNLFKRNTYSQSTTGASSCNSSRTST